ncbi:hypothetical protein [Ancylobacter dichloromethanicus]|uniref:hypothetical protein n=1 Tax=Ancylobacter dichloromethanicus TaxID=518825 RepID=UPI0036081919
MIDAFDWARITALKGDALKGAVFSILRSASLEVNNPERSDAILLPIIPRLADIIANNYELKNYREPFSALARAAGLWNYIDKEFADTSDRLVAEAVTVPELGGITLHREQIGALNEIFLPGGTSF